MPVDFSENNNDTMRPIRFVRQVDRNSSTVCLLDPNNYKLITCGSNADNFGDLVLGHADFFGFI